MIAISNMNPNRILAALCCLAISVVTALGATGRRISDYTETLTVSDAWVLEVAVPGVTNYKVTFGAMATNILARAVFTTATSNSVIATVVSLNTNKADNYNGLVTNLTSRGLTLPALTAGRSLILNASGNITNVSGTPDGTKYVRDDGTYAVPSGSAIAQPISSIQYNSNGVMQGSAGLIYTNGQVRVADVVIAGQGVEVTAGSFVLNGGDTALVAWNGFGRIRWSADGVMRLENDSSIGMTRIDLGGTDAGKPSIGITNGDAILLGADGAFGTVATNRFHFPGGIVLPNGSPGPGKLWTGVGSLGGGAWSNAPAAGGGGDVTTAQLNTASNFLYTTETTRNAAVSNSVVTLLVANDTTTSNGIYLVETTRNAAVSNALVTVVGSHTQMVVAAIGTLLVTNALHVGTVHANLLNLTNALTTNQVRIGMEDLTNSAAYSPQNGELISWNEATKQWINTAPQWADVVTNITVTSAANVLLDFATANVFKLVLRTNLTYTFTNTSYLTKRAKVYFIQDLLGARTLTAYSVDGGIIQTNENMQFNTNAAAFELMAVEKGFWVTNLVTEWQRDYNPRIGPSLLATFTDNFNRANDDPMTVNASDGVGVWTSGPGTYNDCFIDYNVLRGSTGSDNMARVLSPTFIANQSAAVTLAGVGGNLLGCGPAVRIKSTTDSDCYFAAAASTTSISIYSVVDDGATIVDTAIGAAFTVAALQVGDRIKLTISGTTLELFVNEVSQGTRTDATYATGQPGIRMYNTTGGADYFSAIDL